MGTVRTKIMKIKYWIVNHESYKGKLVIMAGVNFKNNI